MLALGVDFSAPVVTGVEGWQVHAGHFAERHGLIIIIALGESVVSIGVGAAGEPLGAGEVTAAVFAIAIVGALWWAYFDVVAIVAERRLRAQEGVARAAQARDSYSYLHFPMVLGITLLALGVKKTLAHVGDPLAIVPAVGLCGGVTIYLLAHIGFRLRNVHSLNKQRLVVAIVCLALIPLAAQVTELAGLGALTALCAGLIAYEASRFSDARERVRSAE